MGNNLHECQPPSFMISEQLIKGTPTKGISLKTASDESFFIYPELIDKAFILRMLDHPEWHLEIRQPDHPINIDEFLKHNNDRILTYANQWIIWGEYPEDPWFRW